MMKDKKETIKCSGCQHCSRFRPVGNTRTEFTCKHPDHKYIENYFSKKDIHKMPGFLGFGARYSDTVPIKTAPAWCPRKKVSEEKQDK